MFTEAKFYFQDIPSEVADDIFHAMASQNPEPTWEEIDHWINCHNVAATIQEWYERVEEFLSDRRLVRP